MNNTCPSCRGTGDDPMSDISHPLPCQNCGGSGRVQTEKARLRKKLDRLLYHASRDLHFLANDIEDTIARIDDEQNTYAAAVVADLIRLASRTCQNAREAMEVRP